MIFSRTVFPDAACARIPLFLFCFCFYRTTSIRAFCASRSVDMLIKADCADSRRKVDQFLNNSTGARYWFVFRQLPKTGRHKIPTQPRSRLLASLFIYLFTYLFIYLFLLTSRLPSSNLHLTQTQRCSFNVTGLLGRQQHGDVLPEERFRTVHLYVFSCRQRPLVIRAQFLRPELRHSYIV